MSRPFVGALILGCKRPLTFHRFKDNQRKRKDAIKTDWIMHEYGLGSIPTELRLCKIKYKGKDGVGDENINVCEAAAATRGQVEEQPMLPRPIPLNNNYNWSNSSQFDQYPIPGSFINMQQPLLHNNQLAQVPTVTEQSPFPDLWSCSWDNCH
ncbi:No apical meristem (NAM) protein [Corchorus olitorius]|uniref:No apical meristem (NAM) protein n=1 Tax=Corchorus olitorius TaxID=93759 RepID=A0A1R3IW98_9ROSI|nr:No apical meristem (NAM) protein [Corchorus olitorius]